MGNEDLRSEIRRATEVALRSLKNNREGRKNENEPSDSTLNLEEGVKYVVKELAFFLAKPNIHEDFQEVGISSSRPLVEKFMGGCYHGIVRPSLGVVVFD